MTPQEKIAQYALALAADKRLPFLTAIFAGMREEIARLRPDLPHYERVAIVCDFAEGVAQHMGSEPSPPRTTVH